ncbi:MAG: TetR family transcriptional regulator [Rhodospirillales bacterium]|nr:TetR family transcriptional regulator [Rhodospirillales bacterium]
MRKSKQETAETRQRILKEAGIAFRRKGIKATGIADLMAAAGLTHGGFYRHFPSKEDLVAEACATCLMAPAMKATQTEPDGLKSMAGVYLAPAHRDTPDTGCVFAGLGSELARADDKTRKAATAGFLRMMEAAMRGGPKATAKAARERAMVAIAAMVGAVTLSRIVTDPKLSAAILASTRHHIAQM